MRNNQQTLGLTLVSAGVAAAAGFLATAHQVRNEPRVRRQDRAARRKVPHDATMATRRGRVIEQAQKIGKWYVQAPLATAAAAVLWRGGHRRAASALSIAAASSAAAAQGFDAAIFHRPPPPGHPDPSNPSFPSGHALQIAAVSLTAGYVLMRERIAPASVAMPLAVALPVAASGVRLWQDRHWASDVVGGWLAGIALAAWSAAAYETMSERRLARVERQATRQARRLASSVEDGWSAAADTVGRGARRLRSGAVRGARDAARGAKQAGRDARKGARRGARQVERVVARTVERGADGFGALLPGRRTGLLDVAQRALARLVEG